VKVTIKVEGLKECEEALDGLLNTVGVSTATGRNTVGRALEKAAEPMRAAMEANAPVRRGQLRGSVSISARLSRRQRSLHVAESPVERFIGAGPLPQAHLTEFGSAHMKPQGKFRTAVAATVTQVAGLFAEILWSEIVKTAERHARKAQGLLVRSK
jgi:HK97 gp10 family phage protein